MSGAGSTGEQSWIFCQLGAREHYVLPRGFHGMGRLRALITDAWAPLGSLAARAPEPVARRVADRFAPDLAEARVEAFTRSAIRFEIAGRLRRRAAGWQAIMLRNEWFEHHVVTRMRTARLLDGPVKPVLFAYSYAALAILREAKAAGCMTILGQIDPAITEENIVADAVPHHASLKPDWERAPPQYWSRWREECTIADRIVVNSLWARDGLIEAGIDAAKLAVVPLAFERQGTVTPRDYPACFSDKRPLRVLFLGSLVIRKGIAELLAAARLLADSPVEFHLVGHAGIAFPSDAIANPRIIRHGPVARGKVAAHYAAADVFILPSLSDGFGLTQIEAQANGLPVIASRRCGDVVRDGVDGLLLDEVSSEAIARAVRRYLEDPASLTAHALAAASSVRRFAPALVNDRLLAVADWATA